MRLTLVSVVVALVTAGAVSAGFVIIEKEPDDRARAEAYAQQLSCQGTGECRVVEVVDELADGLWRIRLGETCLLIDLERFETRYRAGKSETVGVGVVPCWYVRGQG
jgi:hypothetical protein